MKKRKHTKANDWLPIIEAWKKSGLTKKHFCKENNISCKTFYRWYHQLQPPDLTIKPLDKSTATSTCFADFIPITVSDAPNKVLKPAQHYILLFNDKLQLQIPIELMNIDLLQMLMMVSGARLC